MKFQEQDQLVDGSEVYIGEDGSKISREYGKTPNGNDLNGRWVLRDSQNEFVDFDTYCSDLVERNNHKVVNQ